MASRHRGRPAVGAGGNCSPPGLAGKREVHVGIEPVASLSVVVEQHLQGGDEGAVLAGRGERQGAGQAEQGGAVAAVVAPHERKVVVAVVRRNCLAVGQQGGRPSGRPDDVIDEAAGFGVGGGVFQGGQHVGEHADQGLGLGSMVFADVGQFVLGPLVDGGHAFGEHLGQVVSGLDLGASHQAEEEGATLRRADISQLGRVECLGLRGEMDDLRVRDTGEQRVHVAEVVEPDQMVDEGAQVSDGGPPREGLQFVVGASALARGDHDHGVEGFDDVGGQAVVDSGEQAAVHHRPGTSGHAVQGREGR